MYKHKVTKKNYIKVVDKFAEYLKASFDTNNSEHKKFAVDWLNQLLDDLASDDAFGTEGQCDPRGDQRD
jgi:hypothetical protein